MSDFIDRTNYKGPRVCPDPADLDWLDTFLDWCAEWGFLIVVAAVWLVLLYQAVR